jgi:hypothetical protein
MSTLPVNKQLRNTHTASLRLRQVLSPKIGHVADSGRQFVPTESRSSGCPWLVEIQKCVLTVLSVGTRAKISFALVVADQQRHAERAGSPAGCPRRWR